MILVGIRKNSYNAPFLEAQELHSRSIWKANVSILVNLHSNIFQKTIHVIYID